MEVEIGRGKKARRAYGFDDIAIVPSRRTRDPDDVDISWTLGPYRFELPLLASAMDGVVSPETAGIIGTPRRPRGAQPRGHLDPLRGRGRAARAHRRAAQGRGDARDAGDLPGAGQGGADRPAHRGDQGRAASSPPRRSRRSACCATTSWRWTPGSTSSSSRARSSRPSTSPIDGQPLNLKEFVRELAGPGRRRRLRVLPHGPAPHAHRRGRRARRRRPRRGVHHARRARHRRPAGDGDRRRRRPPARSTCSRPASTSR